MAWVVDRPELQAELEEHQALKAVTDGWMARLQADLMEDRKRTSPGHRLARGVGMVGFLLGIVLLTAFGAVEALVQPDVSTGLKLALGLTYGSLGFLLLYLTVDQMRAEAVARGANAILGARFTTSMVMQGSAEILAYGTAVVIEKE